MIRLHWLRHRGGGEPSIGMNLSTIASPHEPGSSSLQRPFINFPVIWRKATPGTWTVITATSSFCSVYDWNWTCPPFTETLRAEAPQEGKEANKGKWSPLVFSAHNLLSNNIWVISAVNLMFLNVGVRISKMLLFRGMSSIVTLLQNLCSGIIRWVLQCILQ